MALMDGVCHIVNDPRHQYIVCAEVGVESPLVGCGVVGRAYSEVFSVEDQDRKLSR